MLSNQLNKYITLQKGADSKNAVGSPIFTWNDIFSTYAKVNVTSGDTRFNQLAQIIAYHTEFLIRYNGDTKLINNKWRVKYNGDLFKIVAIQEIGNKEGFKLITVGFNDNGQPDS